MHAIVRKQKWIGLVVLVTFIWLMQAASAPLPAAASRGEDASPGAVEKEASAPSVAKKKSALPLVLIGVGVVAAAAAVYFLVIKKDKERVHDEFSGAADSLWLPRTPGCWTLAGGYYTCQKDKYTADSTKWWEWSLYNRSWSKPNYTVTTRMRVIDQQAPHGLLLVTDSSMTAVNGYQIMFMNGLYLIRRVEGWDYTKSTAVSYTFIKNWTADPAILSAVGSWNTFKLVKAGGDYQLHANGTLVFSFSDATYDPRLVAIAGHTQTQALHLDVDSFYVDVN